MRHRTIIRAGCRELRSHPAAIGLLIASAFGLPSPVFAAAEALAESRPATSTKPALDCNARSNAARRECGWWYQEDPEPPETEETPPPLTKVAAPAKPLDCTDPKQWTPPCGFVDPGKDWDFQAAQRDQLMKQMVMSVNDPKAVKAFQQYNRWVFDQAAQIAKIWEFNMVQDPSLDRTVTNPVSDFGLRAMADLGERREVDFFELMKSEGAFFVFFTRSDCEWCHKMLPIVNTLSKQTGMKAYNASLDGKCMPGFEDSCLAGDEVTGPATMLKVSVVPDLVVHNPRDRSWVRIASGLTPITKIKARVRTFSIAMRAAVENGVQNSQGFAPSVDFKKDLAAFRVSGNVDVPMMESRP